MPLPTIETSTFAAAALGVLGLTLVLWGVIGRLNRLGLIRLERRYMHRWTTLSRGEKVRVLQIMGVIPMLRHEPEGAPADDSGRLDRLFRAVLLTSGKDLGLGGLGGLVSPALPLALLDAEVEWALSEGTRPRSTSRRSAT